MAAPSSPPGNRNLRKLAATANGTAVALLSLTVAVFLTAQVLNAFATRRQLRATLQHARQRQEALRRQSPRDPADYQFFRSRIPRRQYILPLVRDLIILAQTDPQAAAIVERHPTRQYLEAMEAFDRLFPGESPEDVHLRPLTPPWGYTFPDYQRAVARGLHEK